MSDNGKPHCGTPMRRYEVPGSPADLFPVCGRLAGHQGACVSRSAMRRRNDWMRAYRARNGRKRD